MSQNNRIVTQIGVFAEPNEGSKQNFSTFSNL